MHYQEIKSNQYYALSGFQLQRLWEIQKTLSDESRNLDADTRRNLHQRMYLILDDALELAEPLGF
jgi:hypothetical protein